MNYEKFKQEECFDDFDAVNYLEDRYVFTNPEGKHYFMMNRTHAFMLLKAHKFVLTEKQKKSISYLIQTYKKTGKFSSPPKKPIRIDVTNKYIIDGVTRLFVLLFQRKSQLMWIEYEI